MVISKKKEQNPKIAIPNELKIQLDSLGTKKDTYADIIKRLLRGEQVKITVVQKDEVIDLKKGKLK